MIDLNGWLFRAADPDDPFPNEPAYDPSMDGYANTAPPQVAPSEAPPPPTLTYNDPTAPELYPAVPQVTPQRSVSVPPVSRQRPVSVPSASRDVPPSTPVQNALNLLADPGDTGVQHGPPMTAPSQDIVEVDARRALDASPPVQPPPIRSRMDIAAQREQQAAGRPNPYVERGREFVTSDLPGGAIAAGQAIPEAAASGYQAGAEAIRTEAGRPQRIWEIAADTGDDPLTAWVRRTFGDASAALVRAQVKAGRISAEAFNVVMPGQQAVNLYQAAQGAAGDVLGRRAYEGAGGDSSAEVVTLNLPLIGPIPVTRGDLAGFAGQVGTDVTNFAGGPSVTRGAERAVRAGARVGREALEQGTEAVGRVLEPLGRELGERALAGAPRVIDSTGGGLPPRPLELGERVESALEVVRAVGRRLDEVEEAARRAEDTGTADEIRVANRAYDAVRAQFDEASRALEDARTAVRAHDATLAEAGYGRPVEEADLLARESDLAAGDRQVPDVPRTVDDVPRGGGISLNAGLGMVPDQPRTPRRVAEHEPRPAIGISGGGVRLGADGRPIVGPNAHANDVKRSAFVDKTMERFVGDEFLERVDMLVSGRTGSHIYRDGASYPGGRSSADAREMQLVETLRREADARVRGTTILGEGRLNGIVDELSNIRAFREYEDSASRFRYPVPDESAAPSGSGGTAGLATAGPIPSTPGAGALSTVNRVAAEGIVGGTGGAVIEQGLNPDDPDAARRGFVKGAIGFPLATRGARALPRVLGRAGAQGADNAGSRALATLGGVPGGGGFNLSKFPGVQRAIQASQQRAARLAANGQTPLNPLQWLGELTKTVGYSSMIGPATATVNVFGNLLEPLWSIPKEAARAGLPRVLGGRGNIREFGEMAGGAFHGMRQTGAALVDALAARGRYASNPDSPFLSERTVNPVGHEIAAGLEFGGRIFSGAPDAIFGTIAWYAGEARRAAQIATDEGLKGNAWKQRVQSLLSDVEAQRAGAPVTSPGQVDDIIKSAEAYADRQTFRDQLGKVGEGAAALAGRKVPVLGNLITPFFNTPWNMAVTLAERSPVGAVMNRQRGFDRAYDAVVGTALITGLAFGPAASGKITGSGPDDPEKRQMLQANGWKPFHTLIGDTYVPNRVFGIYGRLLNAAGEAHDALAYQKKDAGARENLADVGKRVGKLLKEEPYLQGMSDLMAMLTDPQAGGVEGYASQNVTRLVPYGATIRTIGTAMDPKDRETDRGKDVPFSESFPQRVRQGLGRRDDLPVAQDVLGREKDNPTPGIWSILPRLSQRKEDPAIQLFLDAGVDIGRPNDEMSIGRRAIPVGLKPDERRRWQAHRGQFIQDYADAYTGNPEFMALPPAQKEKYLKAFLGKAADYADKMLQSEMDPDDLTRRATEGAYKKAGVAP